MGICDPAGTAQDVEHASAETENEEDNHPPGCSSGQPVKTVAECRSHEHGRDEIRRQPKCRRHARIAGPGANRRPSCFLATVEPFVERARTPLEFFLCSRLARRPVSRTMGIEIAGFSLQGFLPGTPCRSSINRPPEDRRQHSFAPHACQATEPKRKVLFYKKKCRLSRNATMRRCQFAACRRKVGDSCGPKSDVVTARDQLQPPPKVR